MRLEERFELPDLAAADFQHDLFVLHELRLRIRILPGRKRLTGLQPVGGPSVCVAALFVAALSCPATADDKKAIVPRHPLPLANIHTCGCATTGITVFQ